MNVGEMKQWLEQFPEDAEVRVIHTYREDPPKWYTFTGDMYNDADYMDFTESKWNPRDYRVLDLGGEG